MNAVQILRAAGMSRGEIAQKLNVSRHAVGWWENGRNTPDPVNRAQLIALAAERGITLPASAFALSAEVVAERKLERDARKAARRANAATAAA